MCLGDPLSKDSRVLCVEEQVDPGQLAVVSCMVPDPCEDPSFGVVVVNQDVPPGAPPFFVEEEPLARDWVEGPLLIVTVSDPLLWEAAVVLCVVEGLEGEPICLMHLWISVVDALLK